MNKIHSIVTGFVCILLAFILNGCTLIGLGIGSAADPAISHKTLTNGEIGSIGKGDTCRVFLRDNGTVVGAFNSVDRLPKEQYQQRYQNALQQLNSSIYLPSLGDTVGLQLTSSQNLRAAFFGIDRKQIEFQEIGKIDTGKASCTSVVRITGNSGRYIGGDSLSSMIFKGQIPLLSTMLISNEKGLSQVPLDKISKIDVTVKENKYWKVGLIMGIILDLALVLAIANTSFHFGGGGW